MMRLMRCILYMINLIQLAYATNSEPNQGQWECIAQDTYQYQWHATHPYQRVASSKALEACKKQSTLPRSCKIVIGCDPLFVTHTDLLEQHWQCQALDANATAWDATDQTSKENAMLDAMQMCKKHSALPDTCYTNDSTCHQRK